MALIECTCAVLENVHERQGRNYIYNAISAEGSLVKEDPAF